MEVQLQDLVEKIKRDGIASAEQQAADIIAEAERKAKAIVADAEKEAETLLKKTEVESQRFTNASEAAVKQACRNALIAFREGVTASLDALIKAETAAAYNSDVLKTLIPEAVKGWIKTNEADISVVLSPEDAQKLDSALLAAFKKEVEKGIEVKSDAQLAGGFRIGVKDGSAYYDFSAEAVADLFSAYISSRAARLLKDAVKEL